MTETISPPKHLRLRRCPTCGEKRNPARHVLCRCDGLTCAVCGEGWIRRPISNHYDESDGKVWHTPWLVGLQRCPSCGVSHARAWARAAATA